MLLKSVMPDANADMPRTLSMAFLVTRGFLAHLISLRALFPRIGIFSAFAAVIVVAPIIGMRAFVGLHVFAIFTVVAIDVLVGGTGRRKQE